MQSRITRQAPTIDLFTGIYLLYCIVILLVSVVRFDLFRSLILLLRRHLRPAKPDLSIRIFLYLGSEEYGICPTIQKIHKTVRVSNRGSSASVGKLHHRINIVTRWIQTPCSSCCCNNSNSYNNNSCNCNCNNNSNSNSNKARVRMMMSTKTHKEVLTVFQQEACCINTFNSRMSKLILNQTT